MNEEIINKMPKISVDKIPLNIDKNLPRWPIATFHQGDKELNFILDTGSNACIIDSTALKDLEYKKLDTLSDSRGLEGNIEKIDTCFIKTCLKDRKFEGPYIIRDMSQPFKEVKKALGITVHGILGTNFLIEGEWVLDFKELIAYSKK